MPSDIEAFYSKVVGVSHNNADGTSRQRIIAAMRVGERLTLDTEPDNPHDSNAVRVLRANGQQIGYLSRDLAEDVTGLASAGYRYSVFVKNLTGGVDGLTRGVNIIIIQAEPDASDREVQAWINAGNIPPDDYESDDDEPEPMRVARMPPSKPSVGCSVRLFVYGALAAIAIVVVLLSMLKGK